MPISMLSTQRVKGSVLCSTKINNLRQHFWVQGWVTCVAKFANAMAVVALLIILVSVCVLFSGSAMSLAAGVLFGGLAAAGTFQMSNDPHNCYLLLGSIAAHLIVLRLMCFSRVCTCTVHCSAADDFYTVSR